MSSTYLRRFGSIVGIIGIVGSYLTEAAVVLHTTFLANIILLAAASICEAIDRTPD